MAPGRAADAPLAGEAGSYLGLCGSTPPTQAMAGAFLVKVAPTGAFRGTLTLGGVRYPLRGAFDGEGVAAGLVLTSKRGPTLAVDLALDLGEGEETLRGTAAAAGPPSDLLGHRLLYSAKPDPAPPLLPLPAEAPGAYGLLLEPQDPPAGGNGAVRPSYATLVVSRTGKVKVKGDLPDGSRLRSRSAVTPSAGIPLFASLYGGSGSFTAWLPLPASEGPSIAVGNPWFRPSMPGHSLYPDGWPAGLATDVAVTRGVPVLRTLTVRTSGDGSGAVTSSPPGIGPGFPAARFPEGTVVTLTAVPAGESAFDGWSGAGTGDATRTVVMDADAAVTAAFRAAPFTVDIDLAAGLVTFPNPYTGWKVGGGSATNFVAYPSGWSVGGGSATNFVAVPPGWSVGGGSTTNFTAVPPGWSVGGGSATNFVAVPPGWSVGGSSTNHFVALPPGWTAGGGPATNFTALPPGWSVGGGSATNFIALPPGWAVGGGSATNFFAYPTGRGWTTGGGSLSNFTGLPPGWTTGGSALANFVAVPPGWVVGGGSATNFVTYPGPSVTTIQLKFDDPGWLACFQVLRDSGSYTHRQLADMVMAAFLNLRKDGDATEANAGDW